MYNIPRATRRLNRRRIWTVTEEPRGLTALPIEIHLLGLVLSCPAPKGQHVGRIPSIPSTVFCLSLKTLPAHLQSFPHLSRPCLVLNATPLPVALNCHFLESPLLTYGYLCRFSLLIVSTSGRTSVATKKKAIQITCSCSWLAPHTRFMGCRDNSHCNCLIQETTFPPPFSRLNLFKSPPMWFTRTATGKKRHSRSDRHPYRETRESQSFDVRDLDASCII